MTGPAFSAAATFLAAGSSSDGETPDIPDAEVGKAKTLQPQNDPYVALP